MLRIHRSHPDDQFAIIPNGALRDPNLSYVARGVLHELLSHSDGWETNADALSRLARQHRGDKRGEGRRAIRAAFGELEEQGYIVRRRVQREGGKFTTVLEVFDTPGHRDTASGTSVERDPWAETGHRGTADGTSVNGTSVSGTSVSGTSTRSTNPRNTKEEEPSEEHSTSLADTRAADAAASARERIEAEWQRLNHAVTQLADADLRDFMWTFENRRPRVYRQCRRDAEARLLQKYPHLRKVTERASVKDQMTYMYALLHYQPVPPQGQDWPMWVVRPLKEYMEGSQAA